MPPLRRLPPIVLGLALTGCNLFFGKAEEPPLPGERVSVLRLDRALVADPNLADLRVELPQTFENSDWPQPGGLPTHAMHHLALPDQLGIAWSVEIGAGAASDRRMLAEPVVAGGRIFTMDAGQTVSAVDAGSGRVLWDLDLTPEEEDDGLFGGGLAISEGKLFVSTAFARVVALDPASGAMIWETPVNAPMRAAPTASDGRVFVVTIDNELVALAAEDGRRLWSHVGLAEAAGLLGGAAPAVAGSTVIAPYSSGELFALRAETGRVLWNENLAGGARGESVAALADIRGRPVIDRDMVIAVSHSGITAGVELRHGGRAWDLDIGGSESPWVAGDFVFMLDSNAEILCLTRRDGRIRWVQSLPAWEDPEDQEGPIYWAGPVLAGDRLIVSGSNGELLAISPFTGELVSQLELPAGAHLQPVVAAGTLYVLTDAADLVAIR